MEQHGKIHKNKPRRKLDLNYVPEVLNVHMNESEKKSTFFNVSEVPNVQMNEIKKNLNFLCGISSKFN